MCGKWGVGGAGNVNKQDMGGLKRPVCAGVSFISKRQGGKYIKKARNGASVITMPLFVM